MSKLGIGLTMISVAAGCVAATVAVLDYLRDDHSATSTDVQNHSVAISNGNGVSISNSSTVISNTSIDNRIAAEGNSVVIAPEANVDLRNSNTK